MRIALAMVAMGWLVACGATESPGGRASRDRGRWSHDDERDCGGDPAASLPREARWRPSLGCAATAEAERRCGERTPPASLRPEMYCAGEPRNVRCGNREEEYLTATRRLPCVCMTDEELAAAVDYCENAPSAPPSE